MRSIKELMSLQGKVALVTGAAGGVGYAASEALAELGANIAMVDINETAANDKAKLLEKKFNRKTLVIKSDLEDELQVRSVPGEVVNKLGRLDVIVNSAALLAASGLKGWIEEFEKQSSESWRRALEVNLTSVFILIQESKKHLKIPGASVINIGSIYGVVGPNMDLYQGTDMGNPAAYAASKGGLLQLTRWLATNLAPGIRVNMVSPGGIFRKHQEPFLSRYESRTPMKRMAKEEDLKGVIAYLAGDLSAYVTGQNILVDGGWTVL